MHLRLPLLLAVAGACAAALAAQAVDEAVHPGYDLVNLRPADFQPKGIGGMDFLADGTMAVCTWGGYRRSEGEVLLISGTRGAGASGVTVRKIAQGLAEPMGLKVVDGQIYVLQRTELSRIPIPQAGALSAPVKVAGGWKDPSGDWTYGLEWHKGNFQATQGGWNPGDALAVNQGTWMEISLAGTYRSVAGGLRNANGIGLGPDGELFTTDNQGTWLPANKLIHLVPGRNYGCRNNPRNPFASAPESPAAVLVPHKEIGSSPSHPILVPSGTYRGQMLAGDVNFGGVQRYFLEKVKGPDGSLEFQGSIFKFTRGLECGVNRLMFGPDGALYMGGVGGNSALGDLGGWHWNSKWFGLQKLVPKAGSVPFDILAVRSLANGFELEFTRKAGASAGNPAAYTARHWRYNPTANYGGLPVDRADLAVRSATLSTDGKRVRLVVEGLKPGFVVHIKTLDVKSDLGETLWAKETWYTLNRLGPMELPIAVRPALRGPRLNAEGNPGSWRDARGRRLEALRSTHPILFPRKASLP